jgi:hypothetical protein
METRSGGVRTQALGNNLPEVAPENTSQTAKKTD